MMSIYIEYRNGVITEVYKNAVAYLYVLLIKTMYGGNKSKEGENIYI